MEWIEKVLDKFESFLKRTFLPSMGFYFFFITFAYFYNDNILKDIELILNKKYFIWFFIVFSIGLSYFLSILYQLIFDNNIKKNYETTYIWTSENKILTELRKQVINKLKKDKINIKYNDYILYQILGKNINTKRYVDDTKTYGIISLSYIITIIFFTIRNQNCICWVTLIICFIIISIFIIFEFIKVKYRSRAVRLYIDFLIS